MTTEKNASIGGLKGKKTDLMNKSSELAKELKNLKFTTITDTPTTPPPSLTGGQIGGIVQGVVAILLTLAYLLLIWKMKQEQDEKNGKNYKEVFK